VLFGEPVSYTHLDVYKRQAMNWGRYAEIFDFDRESHRLILAEPVGEPHPPTTTPVQP